MGDHPNATLVRNMLDAFNSGDAAAAAEFLASDVKWHMIGGETGEGLEGLQAMMSGDGPSITAEAHDVLANDGHAVALVQATAEADGQTFVYRTAEIMHISDGKVTERWAFSDDTQAISEFFAQFAG